MKWWKWATSYLTAPEDGSSWWRKPSILHDSILGDYFGSPFTPGMHLFGTRGRIFILNYACGFAPLFYRNQTKCYSTTLHKVNDTMWLEPFPEIWHSPGTLRVLKGLYAKAKSYPWSHIEVLRVLLFEWHIYYQFSVNSIRRFICKAPEKSVVVWHRIWELPTSEQGSSNPHSSVGIYSLLKAERKSRDSKVKENQRKTY